jgi:hypothetical protein
MEVRAMNKLTKIRFLAFFGIATFAVISYYTHFLPYKAVWLWFPILVFVDYWLNTYAKKRGMVLSDEMTKQTVGKSAWVTFQATIAVIFIAIVYYDSNRHLCIADPRYILAYIAGFMGIAFLLANAYYNKKQGAWD